MSRAAVLRPAARLSAFYAAIFLVAGIQLPFWPVWLAARGLTAREIGIALAAAFAASHLGAMHFLSRAAAASGQSLYAAVSSGLGSAS